MTEKAWGISSNEQDARVIRVFVSSTFRDMQEERDVLVKQIFPEARHRCRERGVELVDVDLRWGVPEEQSRRGEALRVCLAEIENCRPFFVGLLGERYGWVPGEIPGELIQQQPWLEEHHEHSVTELEIVHGVLRDPEMANHAFFYLRDPAYIDTRPAAEQPDLRELPSAEEVQDFGLEEAERRAQERRRKLENLKGRIRASGFPVREDYPDPETLGQLVLEDFSALIDRLYPEGSAPDPLDKETAEHQAFARSRTGVYIGRRSYLERLDAHGAGDGPPLVVLGESGSGKSALLANWALRWRDAHPDDLVLMHFVGASATSSDWRAMLRRVVSEVARRSDIELEIPDETDGLREAFATCLGMVPAKGRLVLALIALDQLEDREGALDLVWLPPNIPANVRLVVSTLPGRPLDELAKRGWPAMEVEPLESSERRVLIERYLGQYAKQLDRERTERIASAPQAASPLFLRALLEELRVFGEHEKLDERIGRYLAVETTDDLFQLILEQYEQDYDRSRPALVEEAMSLLWAARRGLTESEFLALLGSGDEPLAHAHWSPLYLRAESSLVNRSGCISFFHEHLRRAVEHRYLPTEEDRVRVHERLARYFGVDPVSFRSIEELPWQLSRAGDWERLFALLADTSFLEAAWERDYFELESYWSDVERHSDRSLVEGYRDVLADPDRHVAVLRFVTRLLRDFDHTEEALGLCRRVVACAKDSGDPALLRQGLAELATLQYESGPLSESLDTGRELEQVCRASGDWYGIGLALGTQAVCVENLGDPETALLLHSQEEQIYRSLRNPSGLQRSLGNQATIRQKRGEYAAALDLRIEQERLCRISQSIDGLGIALQAQAEIYLQTHGVDDGDIGHVLEILQNVEELAERYRKRGLLHRSLLTQAGVLADTAQFLMTQADWGGALALWRRHERVARRLTDVVDSQALELCLRNQLVCVERLTVALHAAERFDEAQVALLEADLVLSQAVELYPQDPAVGEIIRSLSKRIAVYRRYGEEIKRWRALPTWRRILCRMPKPRNR
jgi:tetratricopeptide (TPR) repeat protein